MTADEVNEIDEQASPPLERTDSGSHRSAESLILVNTGDGKGKSTAAFGTVIRALANDWPVAVVQFLKSGDWKVGEEKICRDLGVDWYAAGDGFTWDSTDIDQSQALAQAAWQLARDLIEQAHNRLLVLDEISYAMTWGWIDTAEVVQVLGARPKTLSVILTGRDMAAAVVEIADTVTEMRNIKHAFDAGIVAKKGIDY